jgi:alpha-methylacyl-CoA racemase
VGPLTGVRIVELAGIGPSPMCAMLLADLGATVLRVDRPGGNRLGMQRPLRHDLVLRNRRIVEVDLKSDAGIALVLELVEQADALIEGFRPGVTERMGLGPDVCLARNPRIVYGRMTGWGQDGPLAMAAGHDLNYIALTGALDAIGREGQPPSVPLNLIGDYAGGALYLALGLLSAIIEARGSGQGQVVDAAMVDGAASLATLFYGMVASGLHRPPRGTNMLDSGCYFYDVYQCADGKWVSVAPLERRFYDELLQRLGIDPSQLGEQHDREAWPQARAVLAATFLTRTRDEWSALLEGTDACFSPVLGFAEAIDHPHLKARGTFVEIDGIPQPAPAPRFSRTPTGTPHAPIPPSPASTDAAMSAWLSPERLAALRAAGTLT